MDAPDGPVAVLGGGVMGEALIAAMLRTGLSPADLVVSEKVEHRAAELAERHGVRVATSTQDAVRGARIVLLAVKPKDAAEALAEARPALAEGCLLVTVVAGLPTSFYESRLPLGTPVVRVMPNTPAVIGQGASAMSAGSVAGPEHLAAVATLLAATGLVVTVPEQDLDAVTAISGSGPAYVFYLVDALAEAGVLLGLGRDQALELAVATFRGAAGLLVETGDHPVTLRERVSSPGGTTVAGLRELDAHGVRAAIVAAAAAARDQSRELAREADSGGQVG
jgi:pyrroline-5-carboxylate reductase